MNGRHIRRSGAGLAIAVVVATAACAGTQQRKVSTAPVEQPPALAAAGYVFKIFFDANHCMTATDSNGPLGACDPTDGPPAQCLKVNRGEPLRFAAEPEAGNEFVVQFLGQSPFGGGATVPSKGGGFEAPTRKDVPSHTRFPFRVVPAPNAACDRSIDPQIILN